MAAGQSILELILRSRKDGSAPREVKKELDDLKRANAGLGAGAERLNLGMLALKGAVLSVGLAALASIPALVQEGIQFDRAQTALTAYTGSADAAAAATEAVQDAADGAISKMDATANATRLFAMGLASTADEAGRLTDIAVTLGATMGKGPKEAFEEFTLLLANQSILRLDTFGISGAKVRERMEELRASVAGMTRETAFMTAVLEEADGKMSALDAAGFKASSSIDRFNAYIEDAKLGVAKFLADGLTPWLDGIFAINDAFQEQAVRIIENSDNYAEYEKEVAAAKDAAGLLSMGVVHLSEEQFNAAKAALEVADSVDEEALALEEAAARVQAFDDAMAGAELSMDVVKSSLQGPVAAAYEKLIQVQERASESTDDMSGELAEAEENLKKVTAQLIFQHASIGLNSEATLELARNLGLLDEKTYAVAAATEHIRQVYDAADGQLDNNIENTEGYLQAIEDLNAEIAEMPPEEITEVRVNNTQAIQSLSAVRTSLGQIQSKTVTIRVVEQRYSQSFRYSIGHQHGAQFKVEGQPGPDRIPVNFMATRGETVTVTPPNVPAPRAAGEPNINGLGVFAGANVFIENTMDLDMLANYLRSR